MNWVAFFLILAILAFCIVLYRLSGIVKSKRNTANDDRDMDRESEMLNRDSSDTTNRRHSDE